MAKGGDFARRLPSTLLLPLLFSLRLLLFLLLERLTMRIAGAVIVAIALLLVASFSPVESYGMEDGGFLLRLILKNIM